jgi:predicted RNA-binding Zn-ribbon protein involved in translation (DUF1610 family)
VGEPPSLEALGLIGLADTVEVEEVMPVRRAFLNGLARQYSKARFECPVCGEFAAVRAVSDRAGTHDYGEFWCLDHKGAFRAPLTPEA